MIRTCRLSADPPKSTDVVLIGFSTYQGSVIAGQEWGAPHETMLLPPARNNSWEDVLHYVAPADKLLLLGHYATNEMLETRGHRAIGVVYRPRREALGNYVPTVLPCRYDALMFIDQTRSVEPLVEVERRVIARMTIVPGFSIGRLP